MTVVITKHPPATIECVTAFSKWYGLTVCQNMDIQTDVAWDHWQHAWHAAKRDSDREQAAAAGIHRVSDEGASMKIDEAVKILRAHNEWRRAPAHLPEDAMPANGCIVVDGIPGRWNPLADDGDALRLAVKLKIDIHQRVTEPRVAAIAAQMQSPKIESVADEKQRLAATRRAIVRAAAYLADQSA